MLYGNIIPLPTSGLYETLFIQANIDVPFE